MGTTILVTGVGGDIGSAVIRCLRGCSALSDCRIVGCDVKRWNQGVPLVDKFLTVPRADAEGYLDHLRDICSAEEVSLLIPCTEPEIGIIARHRSGFESTGVAVMVVSDGILSTFSSKLETAKFLSENGIHVPRTWSGDDGLKCALADCCRWPLVIKADQGCGSRGVRLVASPDEAEAALGEISDPVIQECVGTPDEEYTIGVYKDEEGCASIAFRRELGYGGMSVFVEYVNSPELSDIAERAARACGLVGSMNLQARREGDSFLVFEVNPRISSTVGFREKMGFNDVAWWARLLLEGRSGMNYDPPRAGIVGVRMLDEILFDGDGRVINGVSVDDSQQNCRVR